MKKKKLGSILLCLVMLVSTLGYSGVGVEAAGKNKKKPTLSGSKISIEVGSKKTIKLKNASKATWSVKNKKVVKIVKKAKKSVTVKGIKKGTTYVYGRVNGKSLKCKVTVKTMKKVESTTTESSTKEETTTEEKHKEYTTSPTTEVKKTTENKVTTEKKTTESKVTTEKKTTEDKVTTEKKTTESKVTTEKKTTEDKVTTEKATEQGTEVKEESTTEAKEESTTEDPCANGHTYSDIAKDVKEPRCEEDGYRIYECTICGKEDKRVTEKLGHDFQWVTLLEPKCSSEGIKQYKCTRSSCNLVTKTESIPNLPHTFSKVQSVIEPGCTTEGHTNYQCNVCGTTDPTIRDIVPALGHDWELVQVSSEPTCTDKGWGYYRCKNKNCSYNEGGSYDNRNDIEALGHVPILLNEEDCAKGGKHNITCSRCEEVVEWDYGDKGHQYEKGVCSECSKLEFVLLPRGREYYGYSCQGLYLDSIATPSTSCKFRRTIGTHIDEISEAEISKGVEVETTLQEDGTVLVNWKFTLDDNIYPDITKGTRFNLYLDILQAENISVGYNKCSVLETENNLGSFSYDYYVSQTTDFEAIFSTCKQDELKTKISIDDSDWTREDISMVNIKVENPGMKSFGFMQGVGPLIQNFTVSGSFILQVDRL